MKSIGNVNEEVRGGRNVKKFGGGPEHEKKAKKSVKRANQTIRESEFLEKGEG